MIVLYLNKGKLYNIRHLPQGGADLTPETMNSNKPQQQHSWASGGAREVAQEGAALRSMPLSWVVIVVVVVVDVVNGEDKK